MSLELELDDQAEKLIRESVESRQSVCPKCKKPLQGNVCLNCGETVDRVREHYSDPDFAEYERQVEEENFDVSKLKWEDVPPDFEEYEKKVEGDE